MFLEHSRKGSSGWLASLLGVRWAPIEIKLERLQDPDASPDVVSNVSPSCDGQSLVLGMC